MDGLAVVVSPLISLMKDQVDALADSGVPAACVNSTLSLDEKRRVADEIRAGRLKLLVSVAREADDRADAGVSAADAALVLRHRRGPLHQRLGPRFPARVSDAQALKETFPQRRRARLHGHGHRARAARHRPRAAAARARRFSSARSIGRTWSIACRAAPICCEQVREVIDRHPDDSGIIYCIRRTDVDSLAASLCEAGLLGAALSRRPGRRDAPAEPGRLHQRPGADHRRHGRLRHGHRQVRRAVRDPRRRAEVAGALPAGKRPRRPRRPGSRVLPALYRRRLSDLAKAASRAAAGGASRSPWKCSTASRISARASTCRHRAIVEYFGQAYAAENCEACDVCLSEIAWSRMRWSSPRRSSPACCGWSRAFGGEYTAQVLTGSRDQRILENGHDKLSTWGLLTEHGKRNVRDWIEQLVGQGFLQKTGEYNVLSRHRRGPARAAGRSHAAAAQAGRAEEEGGQGRRGFVGRRRSRLVRDAAGAAAREGRGPRAAAVHGLQRRHAPRPGPLPALDARELARRSTASARRRRPNMGPSSSRPSPTTAASTRSPRMCSIRQRRQLEEKAAEALDPRPTAPSGGRSTCSCRANRSTRFARRSAEPARRRRNIWPTPSPATASRILRPGSSDALFAPHPRRRKAARHATASSRSRKPWATTSATTTSASPSPASATPRRNNRLAFARGVCLQYGHNIVVPSLWIPHMLRPLLLSLLVVVFPLTLTRADEPVRKPFGLEKRVPWTTSKVIGSPEPPPPYRTERVFPKLNSPSRSTWPPRRAPTACSSPSGRARSIRSSTSRTSDKADLALELTGTDKNGQPLPQTIYAFTFHPKFKENGYVYVTWIPDGSREGIPNGTRVSRFTAKGEPPVIDRASRRRSSSSGPTAGTTAAACKFGPDGMLYIVTGDGTGIADELQIGQDLSSILGKLLRIDVDQSGRRARATAFRKDNPFVDTQGRPARDLGLRPAAALAVQLRPHDRRPVGRRGRPGPVGDGLPDREGRQLRLERQEGDASLPPRAQEGPDADPEAGRRALAHRLPLDHRRLRLSRQAAAGADGPLHLRRLRHRPHLVASIPVIATRTEASRSHHRPSRAGPHDLPHRHLRPRTPTASCTSSTSPAAACISSSRHRQRRRQRKPFPRKLSETGLFASTKDHTSRAGVIPYSVNAQLWGDHADQGALPRHPRRRPDRLRRDHLPAALARRASRLAVPRRHGARQDLLAGHGARQPGQRASGWRRGCCTSSSSPARRSTATSTGAATPTSGTTSRPTPSCSTTKGLDKPLKIKVGDKVVEQNYRFPSRAECTLCHTNAAKFALGVNTLQMNRDHDYGGVVANQLATLEHIGLFTKPLPKPPPKLPKLADYDDASLAGRHAGPVVPALQLRPLPHQMGRRQRRVQARRTLPLDRAGHRQRRRPATATSASTTPSSLVPGHPDRSIILHRMTAHRPGPHAAHRLPRAARSAMKLMREWIAELPAK